MDTKSIDKVCKIIADRFPYLNNSKPLVSKQTDDRYLLVFSSSGQAANGTTIQHTVRVVASEEGQIIKMSMSR
jgi:hypothetical protein